ncbi:hypothetical protein D3C71_1885130 [compost metagenome]
MDDAAPAKPEEPTIVAPGRRPAKAFDKLLTGMLAISAVLMVLMAPVRLTFFCEPYPTTTTSSRSLLSSSSVMVNTVFSSETVNFLGR